MTNLAVLAHDEVVRMDPDAIVTLRHDMGEAGAEGVVCRAMEEIANRLSLIERCYQQGEMSALWKTSKGLVAIADQVGLRKLARASHAVAQCAKQQDAVALAATVARLVRLGDRSLTAVWDTPELSV